MAEQEALAALRDVFGERTFRVKDMSNELVVEILTQGGDAIKGRFNNRMKVGVWLTQMGLTQPNRVAIMERASNGRPGTYRVRPT